MGATVSRAMDAKLYYGTYATVTGGVNDGTEIDIARDVTVNGTMVDADVSTRRSGQKLTEPTLEDTSIDFEIPQAQADGADEPAYLALRVAYRARDVIGFKALDRASGEGPAYNAKVTNFTRTETLEGVVMIAVTVKPCYTTALEPAKWFGV